MVLARPDTSNAFDLDMTAALERAVTLAADEQVRAVFITGEGRRFCAGGDVAAMHAADDRAAFVYELANALEAQLRRISELEKPVIAAVRGAVAGAGLAFVLNADLVVAARSTKFLMAYAGIGLTPDCGVSYLLPRAVGQQRALELALTGRVLTAEQAHAWGLIAEVVDDDQLAQRGEALADQLAGEPTFALGQAKRLIRECWTRSRPDSAGDESRTIARAVTTEVATARIARFGADVSR
jgi:2-(1,2-epoxy-1,2-dihydrophenyl)acetyl-CoA isomerase